MREPIAPDPHQLRLFSEIIERLWTCDTPFDASGGGWGPGPNTPRWDGVRDENQAA
jgi:hypothetical protein